MRPPKAVGLTTVHCDRNELHQHRRDCLAAGLSINRFLRVSGRHCRASIPEPVDLSVFIKDIFAIVGFFERESPVEILANRNPCPNSPQSILTTRARPLHLSLPVSPHLPHTLHCLTRYRPVVSMYPYFQTPYL